MLGEQLADVPRVLARRVDLRRPQRDALADDLADRVAEVQQVLRNRVRVERRDAHAGTFAGS